MTFGLEAAFYSGMRSWARLASLSSSWIGESFRRGYEDGYNSRSANEKSAA
jgi:hypothetical protein